MEIDHFFPAKCPDFLAIFFTLDCSIPSFDSNPQVLLVVSVLNHIFPTFLLQFHPPRFPKVSPAQIFDNRRVLHARSQILPSDGEPWVQGDDLGMGLTGYRVGDIIAFVCFVLLCYR